MCIRDRNTEDHDGHDHEIQLEDLAAVDDEEAKACLGGEKLADDDADEAETDVDLHVADDKWNRAGQQDLCEDILLFSSQDVYKRQLLCWWMTIRSASRTSTARSSRRERPSDSTRRRSCVTLSLIHI